MASDKHKRPVTERRVFNLTNCEVRSAEGDGPAVFSGYAAKFNELSVNLGGFRERIQPGAFRAAIEEGDDVRFLINHDQNLILGRTPKTLQLSEDDIGLRVECELPNVSYANDLIVSMERGDITQMSFGFTTTGDEWKEKDGDTGLPIRELTGARLFDVSAVAYPAYPDTTAEIRSMIADTQPELLERAALAAEELEAVPTETGEAEAAEEREDEPNPEAENARTPQQEYEEMRAEAGVSIDENHNQCDGVAVVWNWNGELQSCHADRAAAEAQVEALESGAAGAARDEEPGTTVNQTINVGIELTDEAKETLELLERAGKVLSDENKDKLSQAHALLNAVLSAAGHAVPGLDDMGGAGSTEMNETEQYAHKPEGEHRVGHAEVAQFLSDLRDAAPAPGQDAPWSYDEDWEVWMLTQMLQLASCYMLYEGGQGDDDNGVDAADDAQESASMLVVFKELKALLPDCDTYMSNEPEGEAREDEEHKDEAHDERSDLKRRLRLRELEMTL